MTIRLDFEEDLIEPLLKEHLESGRAIKTLICDAISFYNKAKELMKDGDQVVVGSFRENYVSNKRILLEKKGA